MINGENFFDQPIKDNKVTYKNIRKIATGKGDDYTTGCLLDYTYFREINDESRGTYNDDKQIKFKTTMLKSNLCDYRDAYILVEGKITITGAGNDVAATQADERDKGVAFKNCAPFTSCKSDINDVDIDYCHDIDIVMPIYNLIEYSDNYAKTSGSLWPYYRDELNNNLADSESLKSKIKITGKTPDDGNEEDVEIMVPSKYLSNFWRTLETPLINCEVSLTLT